MTVEEFRVRSAVPADAPLAALWHDVRGEWDAAHRCVQEESSKDAAWVHAYLHRKEGDVGNGRYWYARAGKPEFTGALDDEWAQIVASLLSAER